MPISAVRCSAIVRAALTCVQVWRWVVFYTPFYLIVLTLLVLYGFIIHKIRTSAEVSFFSPYHF